MVPNLSSHALMATVEDLLARERRIVVAFLQHLSEIDRRKLHLEMGYDSLFLFCTKRLKLSVGTSWRRVTAVGLIQQHPIIADYLLDNRLTLAALGKLKDVLRRDDALQILERAAGKTEREVEELVVAIAPKPVPTKEVISRVAPQQLDLLAVGPAAPGISSPEAAPPPSSPVPISNPEAPPPPPAPEPISKMERLTPELTRLHITVDGAFMDELARAKSLRSHVIPDGNVAKVLLDALRVANDVWGKRRRGTGTRACKASDGRYVPRDVAFAVWERDAGCCAYVSADGHRCGSTTRLELHHLLAWAFGGRSTVDNLSLRCAAHNQYHALVDGLALD